MLSSPGRPAVAWQCRPHGLTCWLHSQAIISRGHDSCGFAAGVIGAGSPVSANARGRRLTDAVAAGRGGAKHAGDTWSRQRLT
jgi:hypothetical protein